MQTCVWTPKCLLFSLTGSSGLQPIMRFQDDLREKARKCTCLWEPVGLRDGWAFHLPAPQRDRPCCFHASNTFSSKTAWHMVHEESWTRGHRSRLLVDFAVSPYCFGLFLHFFVYSAARRCHRSLILILVFALSPVAQANPVMRSNRKHLWYLESRSIPSSLHLRAHHVYSSSFQTLNYLFWSNCMQWSVPHGHLYVLANSLTVWIWLRVTLCILRSSDGGNWLSSLSQASAVQTQQAEVWRIILPEQQDRTDTVSWYLTTPKNQSDPMLKYQSQKLTNSRNQATEAGADKVTKRRRKESENERLRDREGTSINVTQAQFVFHTVS